MATTLLIILFAIAAIVAVAFYVQYDSLKKKDHTRTQAADEATAAAQKATQERDAALEELLRKKSEAAELRGKLADLRSKTHHEKQAEKKQKSTAASDLQDALDQAHAELHDERARLDVLTREATGMQEELTRLREGSKKLDEAYKNAQAALQKAQGEAPVMPVTESPAVVQAAPFRTDDPLKSRVESLEGQTRDLRRKLSVAEEESKRARGATSTARRQFMVAKSELDLFREKLVWSEKRVVELEKLAFENNLKLPEREPAPQPKPPQLAPGMRGREAANTGGEGVIAGEADYLPEPEKKAESGAQAQPEAEVATLARPAGAVSGSSDAEAEEGMALAANGPQAVPPMRRVKAEVEGAAK